MDDVIVLKDYKTVPDIVHEYEPTVKFGHIPLVIDNGWFRILIFFQIFSRIQYTSFSNITFRFIPVSSGLVHIR